VIIIKEILIGVKFLLLVGFILTLIFWFYKTFPIIATVIWFLSLFISVSALFGYLIRRFRGDY
jgi:hypothetical protein